MQWTLAPQVGKHAVITGATGGLGYETALGLARAGADVLLTGRNQDKGEEALQRITRQVPGAAIAFARLDLASQDSVISFADGLLEHGRPIDMLINNAGIMAIPQRKVSADGFELQLATNYLGHFSLTARLLPLLNRARVVQLSSLTHVWGKINFADLQSERSYSPWRAYGQSKLAMLMFALELQRRSEAHQWGLFSVAAHPGWARTELIKNGPGTAGCMASLTSIFTPWFSHSAAAGAVPTLFAATDPSAQAAGYYGPDGIWELKGGPASSRIASQARRPQDLSRLWEVSEQLTGARWSKG